MGAGPACQKHARTRGPIRLRADSACTSPTCVRPARELGGLCSQCWRGAAPETRAMLRWEADVEATSWPEFDIVASAEAILRGVS